MVKYGISRDEEALLPKFNSHDEARIFFKGKYGDDFQMTGSDTFDDEKIYFYKLILDRKTHQEMHKELRRNGFCGMTKERMFCTQSIQIMEDGGVHIVH